MRSTLEKYLSKKGYSLVSTKEVYPFFMTKEFIDIYNECKAYTTCNMYKLYSIYESLQYIIKNNLEGALVETGVRKGGVCMFIAYLLKKWKKERNIYLYDTFEGMSEPTDKDIDWRGRATLLEYNQKKKSGIKWAYFPIEEVRANMLMTGYDERKIIFVKGKVEDTIPKTMPDKIAMLRLDTDWHESTKHTLIYLYPRLVIGGALLVDDWGQLLGCHEAVEGYFKDKNILLSLAYGGGKVGIKMSDEYNT